MRHKKLVIIPHLLAIDFDHRVRYSLADAAVACAVKRRRQNTHAPTLKMIRRLPILLCKNDFNRLRNGRGSRRFGDVSECAHELGCVGKNT